MHKLTVSDNSLSAIYLERFLNRKYEGESKSNDNFIKA